MTKTEMKHQYVKSYHLLQMQTEKPYWSNYS